MTDLWAAPCARKPLTATVVLPGSKSVTNRLLVLAALADGDSVLRRPLRSRDTELMAAALRALGVAVTEQPGAPAAEGADGPESTFAWQVAGVAGPLHPTADRIDVGNAGTVARFVPPLATLAVQPIRFDGDPRVRERPLGPLLAALRELGADLDGVRGLPVTVRGTGSLRGGTVVVDASASSQLVSGLLLAAPRFDRGLTVRHEGPPLPSAPHLSMTVTALRAAGAEVDDSVPGSWMVAPGPLRAQDVVVEPDLSTAAAYLAAPLVAGGSVTIPGWPAATTQPGALLPELLVAMGARISQTPLALTVHAGNRLVGIDADLRNAGELTPVLTALACLAEGRSQFRGVGHLRLQETDRLAALVQEVNGLGGDARETADGLEIRPRRLTGGVFRTYDDHRIAMAGAVLALAVEGVQVEDIATTGKTVPDFVGSWLQMLAALGPVGA